MSANRPTVLILASDPVFAREITANWPQDPVPHSRNPEFIVLDEGFSRDLQGSHYDLAIADAASIEKNNKTDKRKHLNRHLNKDLKQSLIAAGKPAIVIHSDPSLDFYNIHGPVIDLRREGTVWPAIAGLVGREILSRVHADARARDAETRCTAAQSAATLGRFMVEMRTNVNNALTTVLGNAELLLQEPGLPVAVFSQADAIRNMALRLHEIFQRFSSIEKELSVAAREPAKKAMSAVAGAIR
jgi:hypothetical protein